MAAAAESVSIFSDVIPPWPQSYRIVPDVVAVPILRAVWAVDLSAEPEALAPPNEPVGGPLGVLPGRVNVP
jgi:hypothetical protein